jgi:penicillin-binding protein-related factor A (putative recombinase)
MGDEKKTTDVYKKLRPNQISWLRRVAEAGGNAMVLYYSREYQKYYFRRFHPTTKEIVIDLS